MPKLTPEESRAIGGAAAEAEKQKKAKTAKAALEKAGKSVDDVKFQIGPLNKGTRIVTPTGEEIIGEKNEPAAPRQQLRRKPKPLPTRADKPRPTVTRGPGGRIVSRKTQPTISKRKQTRTGKKIDRTTGKIAVPLVKRGEGGRAVGTTPEERTAAVTTILPAAGQELMQPASRTFTPQPQGTLRRGGQRNDRGFVAPYKVVKAGVDEALGHLGKMKETLGTGEFDTHHQNFNAVHQKLSEIDPHGLGISLGRLKHETIHGKNPRILDSLHNLVQDRLDEGRRAHEKNVALVQAGRARKKAAQQ